MYDRILVPLDGSPGAEDALPHARSLASRFHSELVLLRVDAPIPNLPSNRYPPQIESAAETYLRGVAEPMILRRMKLRTVVAYGDPADAILEQMAQYRVDMVIVATGHPRGRLQGGGVVGRLLRRSTVPVMVVRSSGAHAVRN